MNTRAKHYRKAAEHHGSGKHETAAHHARVAHGHHMHARHHATEAAKRHVELHGNKKNLTPFTESPPSNRSPGFSFDGDSRLQCQDLPCDERIYLRRKADA